MFHTTLCDDSVVHVCVPAGDARQATAALREAFPDEGLKLLLFFASLSSYEPRALEAALCEAFGAEAPVVGCTSAGQFGLDGFQSGGITALGFYGDDWFARPHLLAPLGSGEEPLELDLEPLQRARREVPKGMSPFGLVLIDGLSMREERLMAQLYRSLTHMPVVGGSAGDDMAFEATWVYSGGRFVHNAAVFVLAATRFPFEVARAQHHRPTQRRLVVTEARPEERIITEINGYPAVRAYCDAIGIRPEQLSPAIYSRHPVTLRVGDDHYIRSIQQRNDDDSLTFLCAIERGIILQVAEPEDALTALDEAMQKTRGALGDAPALIIGFDCILRRLEFESSALNTAVFERFTANRIVGFYTYGEQVNGLHVNQTFTGIAFGGRA